MLQERAYTGFPSILAEGNKWNGRCSASFMLITFIRTPRLYCSSKLPELSALPLVLIPWAPVGAASRTHTRK